MEVQQIPADNCWWRLPPRWPLCDGWAPVPPDAAGAETAFRIVPFHAPELVQRKLVRLPCGVYSAATSPDPVFGDGAGLRLITRDISTG